MFVLMVELEAASGQAEALAQVLRELVGIAADEPGVHFYAVQRDRANAAHFLLCEFYADESAWQAHLAHPLVYSRLALFEGFLATPPRIVQCDVFATTPMR